MVSTSLDEMLLPKADSVEGFASKATSIAQDCHEEAWLGIDLGNTHTKAAIWLRSDKQIYPVIVEGRSNFLMPSIVYLSDEKKTEPVEEEVKRESY